MAPDAPNNASFSFLLYFCLSVSFMLSVNALSFRLIHRDSVHSPLFPGRNLSDTEIFRRSIEISRARMSYLRSLIKKPTNRSIHPNNIAPPVKNDEFMYLVEMTFGSPSKYQFLILDTASHVTWIQCEPCIRCFPYANEIFNSTKSDTYAKLPCNHPLCRGSDFSCSGNDCIYQINYVTPCTTKGVLSTETITASSSSGNVETVPNVAFGCSNDNIDFPYDDSNQIAGVLALGYGDTSILSQLGPNAKGRFSHCLQGFGSPLHSYLRFGNDAFISSQFKHTPLIRYGQSSNYFLQLNDISIGHHRMAFPPGLFNVQQDGSGGTIIDSGSAIGWLHPFAYSRIQDILVRYFEQFNLLRYYGYTREMNLCYVYKADMTEYPSMTYHFKDADLVLPPQNAFFISPTEGYFCFAAFSTKDYTVVGALQQQNIKFVFDVANSQLWFAPEDCSKNP